MNRSSTSGSSCPCQTFSSHNSRCDPDWLPQTANQSLNSTSPSHLQFFNVTPLLTHYNHYTSPPSWKLIHIFSYSTLMSPLSNSSKWCSSHLCPCLTSTSSIAVAARRKRRPTAAAGKELRQREELPSLVLSFNSQYNREEVGRGSGGEELNTRGMRRDLIACPGLSLPEGRALAM